MMDTNNQNQYGYNVCCVKTTSIAESFLDSNVEQLEAELCALLKNKEFNALPIDTLLQE